MADVVEWLANEVAKRKGPWMGVDGKGTPQQKEQLYTPIIIMPQQAAELLARAQGVDHGEATAE